MLLSLPREIRDQIYGLVLGDHVIYLDIKQADRNSEYILTRSIRHEHQRKTGQLSYREASFTEPRSKLGRLKRPMIENSAASAPQRLPFDFLLTCRMIYEEALPLLYSQNRWQLGLDFPTMAFLRQQRANPQDQLRWISKVEMSVSDRTCDDAFAVNEVQKIMKACPNVRSLRLNVKLLRIFDYYHQSRLPETLAVTRKFAMVLAAWPLTDVIISVDVCSPHLELMQNDGSASALTEDVRSWARGLRHSLLEQRHPSPTKRMIV